MLDKLPKIGEEAVIEEMGNTAEVEPAKARQVLELAALKGDPQTVLEQARPHIEKSERGLLAFQALTDLTRCCADVGISPSRLNLDLSIARGLDYYTGTIFETFLTDLPGIGSVCSGGRYDNLAGLFTKQKLPGVGASLGLDRLLAGMEELGRLDEVSTTSQVLITQFEPDRLADYQKLSRRLHQAGIASEVFPESKNLGKQLKYADKKRIPLAIIAGSDEFSQNSWQLKNLKAGTQEILTDDQVVSAVAKAVSSQGNIACNS